LGDPLRSAYRFIAAAGRSSGFTHRRELSATRMASPRSFTESRGHHTNEGGGTESDRILGEIATNEPGSRTVRLRRFHDLQEPLRSILTYSLIIVDEHQPGLIRKLQNTLAGSSRQASG